MPNQQLRLHEPTAHFAPLRGPVRIGSLALRGTRSTGKRRSRPRTLALGTCVSRAISLMKHSKPGSHSGPRMPAAPAQARSVDNESCVFPSGGCLLSGGAGQRQTAFAATRTTRKAVLGYRLCASGSTKEHSSTQHLIREMDGVLVVCAIATRPRWGLRRTSSRHRAVLACTQSPRTISGDRKRGSRTARSSPHSLRKQCRACSARKGAATHL